MKRLHLRWQSLLTLAVLTGGIAVGCVLIVYPIGSRWRDVHAAIAHSSERRAHLAQMLAAVKENNSGDSIDFYQGDFFEGANEAVVLAELQKQLNQMAGRVDVELIMAQPLPSRVAGAQTLLGLRLQMRGALDGVQKMLHGIETARPYLYIDRATLRSDSMNLAVTGRMPGGNGGISALRMVVELDISGARWVRPASDASKAGPL
jgi:Type II secretion system (T2SS), protein M subtype b